MTESEIYYIDSKAYELRNSFNFETPLDMNSVVEVLGGKIVYLQQTEEAVINDDESGSFIISISDEYKNFISRTNFSIAHEIGHLILHMGYSFKDKKIIKKDGQNSIYQRYGNSKEEYEANEFAGAFLMPEEEFKDRVNIHTDKYNLCSIKSVAEDFCVSNQAVIIRGKFLKIFK